MAQPQTFEVTLYPAERSTHGTIQTKIRLSEKYPSKTFDARTTAEVIGVVERFAADHGQGCSAYVHLKSKGARKPAGFDAATRNLYYNLDGPATASVDAA